MIGRYLSLILLDGIIKGHLEKYSSTSRTVLIVFRKIAFIFSVGVSPILGSSWIAQFWGTFVMTTENTQPQGSSTEGDTSGSQGGSHSQGANGGDEFDVEKLQGRLKAANAEAKTRRLENEQLLSRIQEMEQSQQDLMKKISEAAGIKVEGEEKPKADDTLNALQEQIALKDAELELMEASLEFGITSKQDRKYFRFLLDDAMSSKKDGEELSEDELNGIVAQVKQRSMAQGNSQTSTSFTEGLGNHQAASGSDNEINAEKFKQMGMVEKGELYRKNPALYAQLMTDTMPRRKGIFRN